jgi:hypothetical protein
MDATDSGDGSRTTPPFDLPAPALARLAAGAAIRRWGPLLVGAALAGSLASLIAPPIFGPAGVRGRHSVELRRRPS